MTAREFRRATCTPVAFRALAAMLVCALALGLAGCLKEPYPAGRHVVSEVEFLNAESIDASELESKLATHKSSRFLGIWDGVIFDYEILDENVLARDLQRVERWYRARGYYEAHVTAARIVKLDRHHVKVQIRVHEGPEVRVRSADPSGLAELPPDVAAAAIHALTINRGDIFDEQKFEDNSKRIAEVLGDAGYAFAKVTHRAHVDLISHTADLQFHVEPGPMATYGDVTIAGLESIPERPVRATAGIRKGQRYSRRDLVDAQEALQALGVFASVEIREDKDHVGRAEVPITIALKEASLRTVRLGGGARFDVLQLETHLRAGWEHRNFLGGMRRFSIETQPGLVYYPTRIGRFEKPTRILPQNRVHTELRQPSFIEGRTTGFIAGDYNIYPLLYPLPDGAIPTIEKIIGYQELKTSIGVERAFFSHHLFVTPSYNWQADFPFMYQGGKPDGLDTVRVSFPELFLILDFRDDRIEPRRGFYFSNSFQVAGFIFGGTVSDVRFRPEARFYVPLSRNKQVSLATRVTTGFLFPYDYGGTLAEEQRDPTNPDVVRDQHKLLFRAFYSGGPNSNRGYPYRGVGPHGPVGFLVPTGYNCEILPGKTVDDLPAACVRPLGGLTLWEASFEVRFPIYDPLLGATFIDASDVTRDVGQIRSTVPHISVGPGIRYKTPVGPLRVDIGYRVPGLQQLGQKDLNTEEGNPGTIFGLPIAIHIALGEAY